MAGIKKNVITKLIFSANLPASVITASLCHSLEGSSCLVCKSLDEYSKRAVLLSMLAEHHTNSAYGVIMANNPFF